MNNIKVIATWHIIIDKDFSKGREIDKIISFPTTIKVLIHIPQFRYIKYSGKGFTNLISCFYINKKTFGFYINHINKFNKNFGVQKVSI